MKKRKKRTIQILDLLALLTFLATFTPLITPQHGTQSFIMGIPYTMLTGFLVSVFFVILTYLVSITNKKENNVD